MLSVLSSDVVFEMTYDSLILKGGLGIKRHKFIIFHLLRMILLILCTFFRRHLIYRVFVSSLHFDK